MLQIEIFLRKSGLEDTFLKEFIIIKNLKIIKNFKLKLKLLLLLFQLYGMDFIQVYFFKKFHYFFRLFYIFYWNFYG